MIKRLQKGLQAATDVTKQKKGSQQQSNAAATLCSGSEGAETENQGFLCPMCMESLPSPEHLQKHYEAEHGLPEDEHQVAEFSASSELQDLAPEPQKERTSSSGSFDFAAQKEPVPRSASVLSSGSFTCPQCMNEFISADELQSHFQALHGLSENRDGDVLAMRMEMNDLRASLKEEKWYTNELKKELEKLQAQLSARTQEVPTGEDEVSFLMQQIQVLEAGKALATAKMLENEKEIAELRRANEMCQREKQRILEKTVHLSKENVALKAQSDEESSQKIALGDEVLKLRERLNSFQRELDERPSADDVDVLQKELVNAQTLMDKIGQDAQSELVSWKKRCADLEANCRQLEDIMSSLTNQLDNQQSTTVGNEPQLVPPSTNSQIVEELVQSQKLLAERTADLTSTQEQVSNLTAELANVKRELEACHEQLKSQSVNASSGAQELLTLQSALAGKSSQAEDLKRSFEELQRQSNDIKLALQKDLATEKLATQQATLTAKEKQSRIENLETELAALQAQYRDQAAYENELKANLREAESNADAEKRANEKKSEVIEQLESVVTGLKSNVNSLESERNQLLQKIQEGEGTSEAISQLNQEKKSLLEKYALLDATSLATKADLQLQLEEQHRRIQELKNDLASSTDENEKLKQSGAELQERMGGLRQKLGVLETDNSNKAAALLAAEHSLNTQKTELEDRLQSCNSNLESKTAECIKTQSQLEQLALQECEASAKKYAALDQEIKTLELTVQQNAFAKENLEKELIIMKAELQKCSEELQQRLAELDQLRREYDGVCRDKSELVNSCSELTSQRDQQSAHVDALQTQLASTDHVVNELKSEVASLQKQAGDKHEQFQQLEEQHAKLSEAIEQLQLEVEFLKRQEKQLEGTVKSQKDELTEKSNRFEELVAVRLELEIKCSDLETEITTIKSEKEKEIYELEKVRNDLRSERAQLEAEAVEKLAIFEKDKQHFEQTLAELEAEKQNSDKKMSQLVTEMENQVSLKETLEEKLRQKQAEIDLVTENLTSFRAELAQNAEKMQGLQKLRNDADLKRLECEAQVAALTDEKRLLMDRCVNLEESLESEQGRVVEARRKLDDAIAAMHELGRENQSLQIDQSKYSSRRWADDSDAVNCTACGDQFSLTSRKHHCRNCGLIFCTDCSSKSATVASSKKPVRVCDNCYQEISSR